MIELKNEYLTVNISKHGAELKTVVDNRTGMEYLWQANSEYWGRTSPILFPIVGKLKEDTYYVKNNAFHMEQHGFARDMDFIIEKQTDNKIVFVLEDNALSFENFPFKFKLMIAYELRGQEVVVKWGVRNPDKTKELPFSIGAHPAFNLKLFDADVVEDFYLEFDEEINLASWKLENGHFNDEYIELGLNDNLKLTADLFKNDALVFTNIDMNKISLKNMRNNHGVTMDLSAFKYRNAERSLGIWSPYKEGGIAPFICIEPWFGHADTVAGPFEISDKPGILKLHSKDDFKAEYSLHFF